MSAKLQHYKDEINKFLNQDNAFCNGLAKIEEKTKVNRLHIFLGAIGLFSLYLIFGYGAALIVNALGAMYPAYASVKAVESIDKDDDTQWLIYWIVYAAFTVVEYFSDFLFSWFPFYFLAKLIFLCWCMAPISSNGSTFIYHRFIKPFVVKHQSEIDEALNEARSAASSAANTAMDQAKNEAMKQYLQQQEQNDEEKIKDM
ncbi:receptor expression-enhancing protein 5-like [Dendronephthya gigantea]|uniref:receptor expression-enhancing protein 5-like n=1 Tax=Dendronephthya gigantea TaxID=151771 RepID=UPI00106A4C38|nr:receptor expression-enhancing protein 5-like [Dendronephthya gigantea]